MKMIWRYFFIIVTDFRFVFILSQIPQSGRPQIDLQSREDTSLKLMEVFKEVRGHFKGEKN